MKILWLVNIIMPELAEHLGQKPSVFGGWLSGAMEAVTRHNHKLVICTTVPNDEVPGRYALNRAVYYLEDSGNLEQMEHRFQQILSLEQPDVVHVFGTEYPHSLAMARAADRNRLLITVQGAMTELARTVYAGIPARFCRDNPIHRLLRRLHKGGQSIALQQIHFAQRAELEKQTLCLAQYIHGGSEWGNRIAKDIHPECDIFDCGLILRDAFYTDRRWTLETCERHSICAIFTYPIKGFHQLLRAMPRILERFPDAKIHAIGHKLNVRPYRGLKRWIMNLAPDYPWLIQGLIERYNLWEHVVFDGLQNELSMRDRLLKSHVFLAPAIMENQCTALGEALMLGVPSVATRAGAMPEFVVDGHSALLYDFEDVDALADHICRIFENESLARKLSQNAPAIPARLYDREENGRRLLEIYEQIDRNASNLGK